MGQEIKGGNGNIRERQRENYEVRPDICVRLIMPSEFLGVTPDGHI